MDIPDATYTVTANSPSAGWATGDAKGWSDGTWNTPVKTTKLRMVITSGSASPAVAEWQVHAIDDSTPEPTPIDKTELKQRSLTRLRLTMLQVHRDFMGGVRGGIGFGAAGVQG